MKKTVKASKVAPKKAAPAKTKSVKKAPVKAVKAPVKKVVKKAPAKVVKKTPEKKCKCGNPNCKCESGAGEHKCECFEKLLNEIFTNLNASDLLKDYLFTELLKRGYKEAVANAMANRISVDVNIEGDISIIED